MSAHRFFVPGSGFQGGDVRLGSEQAHQICHVLRLRPGDAIIVLDDSGAEYDVTLTTVGLPGTRGRVTAQRPARGEPETKITLFQSLLTRKKFEWVLQKGTEVGVSRFVPVVTRRSIARAEPLEEKKLVRWENILTEAAEQSHRGRIPQLGRPVTYKEAVLSLVEFDVSLVAAPCREPASLKNAVRSCRRTASSIALLIGPEGGFTEDEVNLACENGAVQVDLGPRILRTETAAVVASALILYELGQMEP
jgi:16S rRNA (uracil1498-N3)-methyltransferase